MFTNVRKLQFAVLAAAVSLTFNAASANADTPASQPARSSFPHKSFSPGLHAARPGNAITHNRNFLGFTSVRFNARFRCKIYYSPINRLWFYWYAPLNCYMPYSYIALYPPIGPGPFPPSQIPGGLPPDSTPIPPDVTPNPPAIDSPSFSDPRKTKGPNSLPPDE